MVKKMNKIRKSIYAIFFSMTALLSFISSSGAQEVDSDFDFMKYYVPAEGLCTRECFTATGSAMQSFTHTVFKDPFGNTSHEVWRPVLWDENGDGTERPIDVEKYQIIVEVVGANRTGDGKVHIICSTKVIDIETNDVTVIDSYNFAIDESVIIGGS